MRVGVLHGFIERLQFPVKHLIEVDKSRGIQRMWSLGSAANVEMAHLAQHLFFPHSEDPGDALQGIHNLWL